MPVREDSHYLRKGERLSFYSYLQLKNGELKVKSLFSEIAFGEGRVILQPGLSLFSNGIISQEDNRKVLERFSAEYSHFIFDEYHHHYHSRLTDILGTPSFYIPILLLIGLLFMSLSYQQREFAEDGEDEEEGYKGWNDIVIPIISQHLQGSQSKEQLVTIQSKVLLRLWPDLKSEVQSILNQGYDNAYEKLLKLHRQRIESKR